MAQIWPTHGPSMAHFVHTHGVVAWMRERTKLHLPQLTL